MFVSILTSFLLGIGVGFFYRFIAIRMAFINGREFGKMEAESELKKRFLYDDV